MSGSGGGDGTDGGSGNDQRKKKQLELHGIPEAKYFCEKYTTIKFASVSYAVVKMVRSGEGSGRASKMIEGWHKENNFYFQLSMYVCMHSENQRKMKLHDEYRASVHITPVLYIIIAERY